MKITVALLTLLIVSVSSFAVVRTVSNDPNNPAQYNTVQAALNASNHGDTIYVNGSQFYYPDFQINRRVVLIGAGYNVSNQLNLATQVGSISLFKDNGVNDASGTVIMGFFVNCRVVLAGSSLAVTNVRLTRNFIGNGCSPGVFLGTVSNWTIYNNILRGVGLDGASTNIIIQNNIFLSSVSGGNQSSVIVDHNVFQGNGVGISNMRFATITNNIFVRTGGNCIDAGTQFNTFNNNLSILSTVGPTAPMNSFLGGPNSGAGNLVTVDPLFENVSNFDNYNATFNYRLKSGSTARNASTDGTDLGIYGGSYPFPSGGAPGGGYDTSPLPPIPQITSLNVLNSSLQPGAQLQVNVQAQINN
ncbi:MAG TPA: hypothetical protein VGD40_02190 [Chryseosolibacter sp.]